MSTQSPPVQQELSTTSATTSKDLTMSEKFYDLFYIDKFRLYTYRSYILFQIICLAVGIVYLKQIDPTSSKMASAILGIQILSAVLFFMHILIYFGVCIFRKVKKNQNPFDRERNSIFLPESLSLSIAIGMGLLTLLFLGVILLQPGDPFKTEQNLKSILAAALGFIITNIVPWILSLGTGYILEKILVKS